MQARRRKMRVRSLRAIAGAGTAAVLIAACGSSSSGTGGSGAAGSSSGTAQSSSQTSTPSTSAAVAADKAEYARYLKAQAPITVPTLPSRPPKGLTISVVTCPVPVCTTLTAPAVAAAKRLGWKIQYLTFPNTPAGYIATINKVVAAKPQLAAIIAPFPNTTIAKQLAQLKAGGTKIAEISPSDENPGGPISSVVVGPPLVKLSGTLMADSIVFNSQGAPNTLFVTDPTLAPTYNPEIDAFKNVVTGAGGSVATLNVSVLNIGNQVPDQVVSYLQSHQSVKYVAFVFADFVAGVPQALKVAGLSDQVQIVSRAPQTADLANIKDDTEMAEVGEEDAAAGYRVIDQLARLAMHVPLGNLADPVGWHQIYSKSNDPTAVITPGSPADFYKAWHLG